MTQPRRGTQERAGKGIGQFTAAMAGELRPVDLERQAGTPRDEASRGVGSHTGVEDLQSLTAMLIQADR